MAGATILKRRPPRRKHGAGATGIAIIAFLINCLGAAARAAEGLRPPVGASPARHVAAVLPICT
ncbi:hypothetical protein [Phreatobacter sp.]|uniref:hypothetical protein n=1 Tax=Phreatobacter sp. TaxID=1966341 RepID=UPI0025EC5485|nr:hypothetical protein [Phreatobacter sp.]